MKCHLKCLSVTSCQTVWQATLQHHDQKSWMVIHGWWFMVKIALCHYKSSQKGSLIVTVQTLLSFQRYSLGSQGQLLTVDDKKDCWWQERLHYHCSCHCNERLSKLPLIFQPKITSFRQNLEKPIMLPNKWDVDLKSISKRPQFNTDFISVCKFLFFSENHLCIWHYWYTITCTSNFEVIWSDSFL